MDPGLTPSQTVGPFFEVGLTGKQSIGRVAGPEAAGERIFLTCRVLDADGVPVEDAMLEIWQADASGNYPSAKNSQRQEHAFRGFGRLGTAEDGRCIFETIKPGRVSGPEKVLQAPHVNLNLFARGLLKHLPTRIYFAGDPANEEDPILGLVPEDRRATLMAQPDPGQSGAWYFEIHLGGDCETVFFDV